MWLTRPKICLTLLRDHGDFKEVITSFLEKRVPPLSLPETPPRPPIPRRYPRASRSGHQVGGEVGQQLDATAVPAFALAHLRIGGRRTPSGLNARGEDHPRQA